MAQHSFSGGGCFPDVALTETGAGAIIFRAGNPQAPGYIVALGWAYVLPDRFRGMYEIERWAVPGESPAFPRVCIHDGLFWFAYHDGIRGHLRCPAIDRHVILEPCQNNSPIAFGRGMVAWQGAAADGWPITLMSLTSGETHAAGFGNGEGLAYIADRVVTVDENRQSQPGMYKPVQVWGFIVGEDPDPSNINNLSALWREGPNEGRMWPTQPSLTPRNAKAGSYYAVTTWGQGADVRLFAGTLDDLIAASAPAIPQPPDPQPEPIPEPSPMPDIADQKDTVQRVRAKYPTPLGTLHATCLLDIAITIGQGAGLLDKPSGTNIELPNGKDVAQDIICFPDGHIYDCLGDAENEARPDWQDKGFVDASRYVAVSAQPVPSDPPDEHGEPTDPNPGPVPTGVFGEILTELRRLNAHLGVR